MFSETSKSPAAGAKAAEAGLPLPVSSSPSASSYRLPLWPAPEGLKDYIMTQVNPDLTTIPLAAYCFMTGWMNAISFSAIFVWCGFQSGNTLQLALALARLGQGLPEQRDTSFHLADKQALTSLTTFLFGVFIGRIGDRIGAKTRLWLFLGTLIQALFTMAAAIAHWKSGQGSVALSRDTAAWTDASTYACLGLMSASMGLQGVMGSRMNTQFATTVPLTSLWCELMSDPMLFARRRVASRDHKIIGVTALFVGGFSSRAILQAIGSPATLFIGTGLRALIAVSWFFVPGE